SSGSAGCTLCRARFRRVDHGSSHEPLLAARRDYRVLACAHRPQLLKRRRDVVGVPGSVWAGTAGLLPVFFLAGCARPCQSANHRPGSDIPVRGVHLGRMAASEHKECGVAMRKLLSFHVTSVDGYYEGPGQAFDWPVVDEEFNRFAMGQLEEADTLLFGRVTYHRMAATCRTPAGEHGQPAA